MGEEGDDVDDDDEEEEELPEEEAFRDSVDFATLRTAADVEVLVICATDGPIERTSHTHTHTHSCELTKLETKGRYAYEMQLQCIRFS